MRIPVGNCNLHCEVIGAGQPILFVHGFPLCGEMWLETARRLGDGWRSIIPDLRGHGHSDATPAVTITQFADDLVAVLDAVGEPHPVVLVGLSMGGVIAFEFFRRHRDRLRALVLADCRASPETRDGSVRRETLARAALKEGSQTAADAMIETVFAPTASPGLRQYWHGVMAGTCPLGVAAASRALAARQDSSATLSKIDCPTLVVVGQADAITPVDLMRDMHKAIPASQFVVIPDAGHVPPVEQPEWFADVLRRFLERLR
jgi:pimeloyl-ACP methyl ester carboxylesterase